MCRVLFWFCVCVCLFIWLLFFSGVRFCFCFFFVSFYCFCFICFVLFCFVCFLFCFFCFLFVHDNVPNFTILYSTSLLNVHFVQLFSGYCQLSFFTFFIFQLLQLRLVVPLNTLFKPEVFQNDIMKTNIWFRILGRDIFLLEVQLN